jgi:hypothetical protein
MFFEQLPSCISQIGLIDPSMVAADPLFVMLQMSQEYWKNVTFRPNLQRHSTSYNVIVPAKSQLT